MRLHFRFALASLVLALFCVPAPAQQPHPRPSPQAVDQAVRAFMQTVARDVTHNGPAAWRGFFLDSPGFFMAAEGHLVFPNRAAADKEIDNLVKTIKHIDLNWGSEIRVDALTPTLAVVATPWHEVRTTASGRTEDAGFFTATVEFRDGRWQFRDLHWSEAKPAPAKTTTQ